METGQSPPELRLLWPEIEQESVGQPIDNETAILAERRAKAFRLYTRGLSIRDIAEHETVKASKSTVARDVQHVLESYRLVTLQDAVAHVARQLSRLAYLENEALAAWERSKATAEETSLEESDGQHRSTRLRETRKQRDGDPRFLQVARDCWMDRCKLLRMIGPESETGKSGSVGKNTTVVEIELGPLDVPPPPEV